MKGIALKLVQIAAVLLVLALAGLLALRAWDAQRGPPLSVWHTYVPDDLPARKIAKLDWPGHLEVEQKLVEDVRRNVTAKLAPEERIPQNRYFDGSPIYPPKFAQDWNRSYLMAPDGAPTCAGRGSSRRTWSARRSPGPSWGRPRSAARTSAAARGAPRKPCAGAPRPQSEQVARSRRSAASAIGKAAGFSPGK